ncbi:MAG: DnaJ domain-containing protein [Verrucomicrobia bacterium]|nr:DnaJ domain-containing protein [Verrucomicrobiota bacterium]
MQLPGRLARTTLGDLLGRLHREQVSGVLEITVRAATVLRHRIHLAAGLVVGLELDPTLKTPRLGEVLVAEGLAPRTAVEGALGAWGSLGDVLVSTGVLSRTARDAALKKQLRDRVEALFSAVDGKDGDVRFHVGIGAATAGRTSSPLTPAEFLHGRKRARGEESPAPAAVAERAATPDPRADARRLLGVDEHADDGAVRRAFRALAARVHPDRHTTASPWERARLHLELARLTAAYHLLSA